MAATIRWNSEQTLYEIETPEGDVFTDSKDKGDPTALLVCDDGTAYLGVLEEMEGLKLNTLYRLVEVPTAVEPDVEITLEEEY